MIYLDNAATTKPRQDVLDTFLKVNESLYFNPNSPHKAGIQAEQLLQQSKDQIKELFKLEKILILFLQVAQLNRIILPSKGLPTRKEHLQMS